MFCAQCGTQYEGNACPNGCENPKKADKPKKPFYKKVWFWIIVAIVAIIILPSGGNDDTEIQSDVPSTVSSTDATGDQKETVQTTQVSAEDDSSYHVGDTIDVNGLKIKYCAAEKWEESNQFMQPDEGYMYIRLLLSAENTSSTDRYISAFEFECYADGKKEEAHYSSTDALEGGTLSSGRKDEGYIYFMVPINAEEIEVEYETNVWTDKKAVLKVELN